MYLMKYQGKVRGGRVELGALAREPIVADELNTMQNVCSFYVRTIVDGCLKLIAHTAIMIDHMSL